LKELEDFLAQWGGKYHRIPPQAPTSTTAKIRRIMFDLKEKVRARLKKAKTTINGQLEEVDSWIDQI